MVSNSAPKSPTRPLRRPRISAPERSFATVIVGPKKTRFVVDDQLLIFQSEFFRGALMGGFKESKDKTIVLPEDDSFAFEIFVHWLYYQRFPNDEALDDEDLISLWTSESKVLTAVQVYIIGDKYDVPRLREAVMDELYDLVIVSRYCINDEVDAKNLALENLDPEMPLCRFLVDVQCFLGGKMDSCFYPLSTKTFLERVCERYASLAYETSDCGDHYCVKVKLCTYHEHINEDEKTACKKRYYIEHVPIEPR